MTERFGTATLLEAAGATVPPDDDPRHVPWARHHARLAESFGPAELAEPLYLRAPDADKGARAGGGPMIELRPLTLSELGQIEKIERRSYPTPWSRSMFAGELAKPSSHCVGAFDGIAAASPRT